MSNIKTFDLKDNPSKIRNGFLGISCGGGGHLAENSNFDMSVLRGSFRARLLELQLPN